MYSKDSYTSSIPSSVLLVSMSVTDTIELQCLHITGSGLSLFSSKKYESCKNRCPCQSSFRGHAGVSLYIEPTISIFPVSHVILYGVFVSKDVFQIYTKYIIVNARFIGHSLSVLFNSCTWSSAKHTL